MWKWNTVCQAPRPHELSRLTPSAPSLSSTVAASAWAAAAQAARSSAPDVEQVGGVLARDDEHVSPGRRVDVHEGDRPLVLAHRASRGSRRRRSCRTGSRGRSWPHRIRFPRPCRPTRAACAPSSSTCRRSTGRPHPPGSGEAAEWLRDELRRHGAAARIEEERATGSFAVPVALLCATGAAAGLSRGARPLAAAPPASPPRPRSPTTSRAARTRSAGSSPRRTTANVVAEAGDPDGAETVVFVAHHDAANGGLVFHPGPTRRIADAFPDWYARAGDVAAADAPGRRRARRSPASARCWAAAGCGAPAAGWRSARRCVVGDIAARGVVPGANDNLAAVAVLVELAPGCWPSTRRRACACCSSRPAARSRSWRGCAASSPATAPRCRASGRASSCSSASAAPEAIVLEGEGMLRMHDYTPAMRDWLAACGERAGAPAAPRPALGLRDRRADRAEGRLPDRRARLDRRVQDGRRTTTRGATSAANVDLGTVAGVRRRSALRGGALAQPSPASSRARAIASSRVAIAPAKRSSSSCASSSPSRGPGLSPSSRASSSPRTSGGGRPSARRASAGPSSSRASSRWAAIAGLGVAAARGEPVGDREAPSPRRERRGRLQVAPHHAAVERPLVHEEAEPQVVQAERARRGRRASRRRAAARRTARAISAPSAVVAGEADPRPSGRARAGLRLGGVVQQRGEAHRPAARQLVRERLGAAAPPTASACSPKPAASRVALDRHHLVEHLQRVVVDVEVVELVLLDAAQREQLGQDLRR